MDTCGFPKNAYYFHQALFIVEPMLHILPHWNWTEGQTVRVMTVTNCDEVELLLNGKSLGRKPAGEQAGYYVLFDTVYQPGTLEAVSYENGEVIGKSCLTTADGPCHLAVEAEQPGTEEGLIYINIAKLAASGAVAAHADEILTVAADNSVRILGFGSGDPKPVYSYSGRETKTFNGRALLVVQKIDPAQTAQVTITSETGSVTVSI
jgi:beta-galactosidase